MRLSSLQIQTQNAQLTMQNAIPRGKLEIHQESPAIIIEITHGKLEIDSTESRAALGYKTNSRLFQDVKEEGREALVEFIQKKAVDGEQLEQVGNGKDAFAEIAFQRSFKPKGELTIVSKPLPEIRYTPGTIHLQLETPPENAVQISYTPSQLICDYIPGKVSIDVKI